MVSSRDTFRYGAIVCRHFQQLMLVAVWLGFAPSTQTNPGFQFRVSSFGLNYGSTVAVDILSRRIQQLQIPDMHDSTYDLTNMQVTSFTKPSTNVVINAGIGLTWQMNNAGISMKGDWRYEVQAIVRILDSGSFDCYVSGASLSVSVSLGQDASGHPTISSTHCQCRIDSVKIRMQGGASWLYNIFIRLVEVPIRKILEEQICTLARKAIDVDARAQLATMPTAIDVREDWVFDYRLVSPPAFQSEFLDYFHKGEFFAKGDRTEAPFRAAVFPPATSMKMVTIWVSDYILNTVGYVLYKRGIFKHNLTENELPVDEKGVLNTTCTSSTCFGFLVPQVATVHPNASVELEMIASSYPTASISAAGFRGNFAGLINFYARLANGSLAPMFRTKVSVTFLLTAYLDNMVIQATVTDFSSKTKLTQSEIGHIPDDVLNAAFNLIANIFIIPNLNTVGENGIPFPSIEDVRFTNTELEMDDHCVRIATDVQYSPPD